jgi:carbon starvation protein
LVIVLGWAWLISSGSIATIWPMFGIANQLLASVALVVATTILLKESSKRRYALVTALPLAFVGSTTVVAGLRALVEIYLPMAQAGPATVVGRVCSTVTVVLLLGVLGIVSSAVRQWVPLVRGPARLSSSPTSKE